MNQMRKHRKQTSPSEIGGHERIHVEVAIEIPARPEVVFAYLSNLKNNPQWNWAVTHTMPLDDLRAEGARYRQERAWPRPGRDLLEVTVYDPPRLLEVVAEDSGAGPVRYQYRLRPVGRASTRLEARVELQPVDPTPNDMYGARLASAIATNLEDLREAVVHSGSLSSVAER